MRQLLLELLRDVMGTDRLVTSANPLERARGLAVLVFVFILAVTLSYLLTLLAS